MAEANTRIVLVKMELPLQQYNYIGKTSTSLRTENRMFQTFSFEKMFLKLLVWYVWSGGGACEIFQDGSLLLCKKSDCRNASGKVCCYVRKVIAAMQVVKFFNRFSLQYGGSLLQCKKVTAALQVVGHRFSLQDGNLLQCKKSECRPASGKVFQ